MEDITKLGELLPRFLIEMLVAITCGGLIGLERGLRRKAAGLRDYILICLGAVLFMEISELLALSNGLDTTVDPGRLPANIVIGIGIIGAGVIMRRRADESSLTSAATIWVVAAVGLIIGAGYPLLGMLVTGAILLTMVILSSVERQLKSHPRPLLLKLTVREDTPEMRAHLNKLFEERGVRPESFRAEPGPNNTKLTIKAPEEPDDMRGLLAKLWTIKGVIEAER